MEKLKAMVMEKSIYPAGQSPVYGEDVLRIRVDDEAVGGFLVISQSTDDGFKEIKMTVQELCLLYQHGREMMQDYDAETDSE